MCSGVSSVRRSRHGQRANSAAASNAAAADKHISRAMALREKRRGASRSSERIAQRGAYHSQASSAACRGINRRQRLAAAHRASCQQLRRREAGHHHNVKYRGDIWATMRIVAATNAARRAQLQNAAPSGMCLMCANTNWAGRALPDLRYTINDMSMSSAATLLA